MDVNENTMNDGSSAPNAIGARQNMGHTYSGSHHRAPAAEEEETLSENHNGANTIEQDNTPAWDTFEESIADDEALSCAGCYECSNILLKLAFILICLCITLGCTVASKMGVVFITSNLHLDNSISLFTTSTSCLMNETTVPANQNQCGIPGCQDQATGPLQGVRWMWCLLMCISFPYLVGLIRSCRQILFKKKKAPKLWSTIFVLLMESLHTLGLMLLLYWVLPQLDVTRAVLLMTGVGLVPSLLRLSIKQRTVLYIFDGTALVVQISATVFYPVFPAVKPIYTNATCDNGYWLADTGLAENVSQLWPTPLALILISATYWENFIDNQNNIGSLGTKLMTLKTMIHNTRAKTMAIVYIWKLALTFGLIFPAFKLKYPSFDVNRIFDRKNFYLPDSGSCNASGDDIFTYDWLILFGVQAGVSLLAYLVSGLCVMGAVQKETYSLALTLATPITLSILQWACTTCTSGIWQLGTYAFWNCFSGWENWQKVANERWSYFGFLWWLSQLWITRHLWMPQIERLARTDRIFVNPGYCGALIEQSLAYNRRRNDKEDEFLENKDKSSDDRKEDDFSSDTEANYTPCIKLCATMWHENMDEMTQILKSMFRLDRDNGAKGKKEVDRVKDKDYYELECHIFFDDAFEAHAEKGHEYTVNRFVKQLAAAIERASFSIYKKNMKMEEPTRYPTPYGGRLEYVFPRGNKLFVHMKDKMKIRHRKRWSQVMYMYYFLGHNLQATEQSAMQKEIQARHTFLLALDGDVDFKPEAVLLLLDLMKRNHKVGAACGRIHPIGSGPLIWYQKFEYSIGHWLQKATEHVLGCVLCSPGCFSLFRASSLMDDNVMKTYSKRAVTARDHVQYDQGEDRWLCTLLLQQGYRVEYSAAADALTYAPESFNEFFNQRRRWTPSTMSNILDLLQTGTQTVKKNENISRLYIAYQATLFITSILGPGTIFLLIIGALQLTLSGIGGWISFLIVFFPFLIFVIVTLTTKTNTQLIVAAVISGLTMILQMAVLVGLILVVTKDGLCNPATWIMMWVLGVFCLAALLHPQEGLNVLYFPIYFIFVPTMNLLLIIYSMCNLNNISWGTREVPKTQAEKEKEAAKNNEDITHKLGDAVSGGCCSCLKPNQESIAVALTSLQRLQLITAANNTQNNQTTTNQALANACPEEQENPVVPSETTSSRPTSIDYPPADYLDPFPPNRDDMVNPKWLEDDDLGKGPKGTLPSTEIEFWKDLIKRNLKPLEMDAESRAQLSTDLKDLRDKSVLGFFMINALFIALVIYLQAADVNVDYNCTLGGRSDPDDIKKTVQPIAVAFTVIFGLVMALQVAGMLLHRLFSLLQVISSTSIRPTRLRHEDTSQCEGNKFKEAGNIGPDVDGEGGSGGVSVISPVSDQQDATETTAQVQGLEQSGPMRESNRRYTMAPPGRNVRQKNRVLWDTEAGNVDLSPISEHNTRY